MPDESQPALSVTRQRVTTMYVHLRNFSLVRANRPPDQTIAVLREFYAAIEKVLGVNAGNIQAYLGESAVAVFGLAPDSETHAHQAVRAALELSPALQDLFVRLDEEFGWLLGLAIGLSTEETVVGRDPETEEGHVLALGISVEEAQHLAETTEAAPEEDALFVSGATHRLVGGSLHVLDLGERPLGTDRTLHVYAVQGFRAETFRLRAA